MKINAATGPSSLDRPRATLDVAGSNRSPVDGTDLWPATLYVSLEELVEQGGLEEIVDDERPEGISGRERFYRITRAGCVALKREATRPESLARVARTRLALGGA